jgi:glycosyltransferase involved in cell wall biosynthesis
MPSTPVVAIITRTKDRPLALARALKSISKQDFNEPLVWVVCDDGVLTSADWIKEEARLLGINCKYLKIDSGGRMEVASNAGIKSSESEFVVIHDDDDTWETSFLSQTVDFLREKTNYMGVVTLTTQIFEKISHDGIIEKRRTPYNGGLRKVQLAEIAKFNLFPPISFLYKRSVYEKIGLYNENFPVLGDWDFNLRFLLNFDIGVIPRFDANYHWRIGDTKSYGNSVTDSIEKHIEFDAIIRNYYLRQDLLSNKNGLGFLMSFGILSNSNSIFYHDYLRIRNKILGSKWIKFFASKILGRNL